MNKQIRQLIGLIFSAIFYHIIHEVAHLVVALAFRAFKKITFLGIVMQVDIYRERLTNIQLGVFGIAGVTATLFVAYALVYFKERICLIESKVVKTVFYYATMIMLVLDPTYLCLLSFAGGDMNGIIYLMPNDVAWTVFAFILNFNLWVLMKKVTPMYSISFNEN